MTLTTEAPDLVGVLLLPFTALLLCAGLGLAVYAAWGRIRGTH